MIIPDANLLLYAVDDTSPFHPKAKSWLEGILNGKREVGLCHPVIFAFIRISTHRKVFQYPLSLNEAFSYMDAWVKQPVCRILDPTRSQVEEVKGLLLEAASSGGNLVTDAQIASLAIAYKATVHTADRDFLRFKKAKVQFPLDT